MKKIFLSLLLSLLIVPGYAQEEEAPAVREDAFLAQKEIAVWRTDKVSEGRASVYACQAVRIQPQWLLTAAHCVYQACQGPSGILPCTVEVTLAEAELRQRARVLNTTASKNVFIYGGFSIGQNRISSLDVALVRLDPQNTGYTYEKWNDKEKQWEEISKKQFDAQLFHSPETKAQLSAAFPRLISVAGLSSSSRLLPQIVVPRITNGEVSYLISPSMDVFFVQELQHFISPGFGVRRGNSGGGVFTAAGDLTGLVSSLIYSRNGSASFQNEEGKTVLTLQNARDYFLFTGFNAETMNFIRNHVPNLRVIGAENGFVEPTDKPFTDIVKTINQTSLAL